MYMIFHLYMYSGVLRSEEMCYLCLHFYIPKFSRIFIYFNYVKTEIVEEVNEVPNEGISSATCSLRKGMSS